MSSPENFDLDLIKKEVPSEGDQQEAAQPEKRFQCTLCNRSYISRSNLLSHMNVHKKKYKCQECKKCFEGADRLKKHEFTHVGKMPHSCSNCDFSTALRRNLFIHYKRCLKKKPKDPRLFPFECKTCKKRYVSRNGLKQHRYTHTDRYKCGVCGLHCHSSTQLHSHSRIHTGERPVACPKCPYRARDQGALTAHKKHCKGKKALKQENKTPIRPNNPCRFLQSNATDEDLMGGYAKSELSEKIEELGDLEVSHYRNQGGEFDLWRDCFSADVKVPPDEEFDGGEDNTKPVIIPGASSVESWQKVINNVEFESAAYPLAIGLPDASSFEEPAAVDQFSTPAQSYQQLCTAEDNTSYYAGETKLLPESSNLSFEKPLVRIERDLQREIVELKKDFEWRLEQLKEEFDEKIKLQMLGYRRHAESQMRVIDTVAAIGEKVNQLGHKVESMQKQQNRMRKQRQSRDHQKEEGEISSSENDSVGSAL